MSEPKPQNLSALEFFKYDIRVGSIVSIEEVPKSKKLLKMEVSFGPEIGNRIVMGGVKAASPVVGQKVVAVLNLAPRSMMGVESTAMLLASHTPQDEIRLVNPGEVIDGTEVG